VRVAFVAVNLTNESHLWMTRQLRGLADSVFLVSDTYDLPCWVEEKYETVLLRDDPLTWTQRGLRRLGVAANPKPRLSATRKLEKALRVSGADVVLVHFLNEAVKLSEVWQSISLPVYIHCHGGDVTWDLRYTEGPHFGKRVHYAGYEDDVRKLPTNTRFIANSDTTRKRLEAIGISHDRIFLKHMSAPIPVECPEHNRRDHALKILFLGRLVDLKGPDLVIRAFEKASALGLDAQLTMAGDGPMRGACELLRARSALADRIIMLGAVDARQGALLMIEADIFTTHNCFGPLSRQEEAFGVAYVEAMAAGLPVLTGASGGLREIITDGQNGLLFEPGDLEAHTQGLLALARDPLLRERLGYNGWDTARKRFSLEREIADLRSILSGNAGASHA
jgi:glycosyltransferase involved in cell wall biosynthesis